MRTGFIYDEIFLKHNELHHPENKDRLISIMRELDSKGTLKKLILLKTRRATPQEVALNHEPSYIQELHDFCSAGGGYLDPDTYAYKDSYEVALHAVGAILQGIDHLLNKDVEAVFCAVRPPGHHAERSKAMGFCLFNNVAVGGWYLLNKGIERVFIVDFDAHHGNGTQRSFYEEDRVFYFSTHQYPFYPGTGSAEEKGAGKGYGYTHNVPMKAYSGDEEYIKVYREILPDLVYSYRPQFMLVSAGYDIHKDDPLTYLNVSTQGIGNIVESLVSISKDLSIPVLFALEGGYNLRALAESVNLTLEILLKS
ncbi:histone deacetylase family protein [Thermocrinis minervae]|uniref:Acetoin utilization deacetylase AcuC n=1 Tax=Thermocrinis minervae TaxID=381751 RepID=A0A1M6R0L5_9AQUI|nr:histone deacetylase [Thermocrinis minervae]SHK25973.1 Acetoin utilization deacetylase AcuC [Thermocrinis minervae]